MDDRVGWRESGKSVLAAQLDRDVRKVIIYMHIWQRNDFKKWNLWENIQNFKKSIQENISKSRCDVLFLLTMVRQIHSYTYIYIYIFMVNDKIIRTTINFECLYPFLSI